MTSPASAPPATERATFFRQGGWMMLATLMGGVLSWAVHLLSKFIPASEYGTLITLLSVVNLVPTLPLQMVFAQQSGAGGGGDRPDRAAGGADPVDRAGHFPALRPGGGRGVGLASDPRREMASGQSGGAARPAGGDPALAVAGRCSRGSCRAGKFPLGGLGHHLERGRPADGGGVDRPGLARPRHGHSRGLSLGWLAASLVGAAQTRAQWRAAAGPFDHQIFRRQMLPLMLGFAATQFLFSADTVFVNFYFGADETAPYGAAGTLSRALLWVVLPLAGVMFPKIVRSHVASEKNNLSA